MSNVTGVLNTSPTTNPNEILIHLGFIRTWAISVVTWFEAFYSKNKLTPLQIKINTFIEVNLEPLYKNIKIELSKLLKFADNLVESLVNFAKNVWWFLNAVLMSPVTAQILIIYGAFYLTMKYNLAVLHLRVKGYYLAWFLPLIPIWRIAEILENPFTWILDILRKPLRDMKRDRLAWIEELKTEIAKAEAALAFCLTEEHKIESGVEEHNVESRVDKGESESQDTDAELKNTDEDKDEDIDDGKSKVSDEVAKEDDNSESEEDPKGMVEGLRLGPSFTQPSKDVHLFPSRYFG